MGGVIVMAREEASPEVLCLERILHALGDTVRLGIVRQLARDGESSCAALNGNRSKSTMSHHFRVLREAGLVRTRNQGVTHMNALCADSIDAAFPGLLGAVIAAPSTVPAQNREVRRSQPAPDRRRALR